MPESKVVRCALRADPDQNYYLHVPERRGNDAPLLVSVHGLSRKAFQHARLLGPYADEYGVVVLAPHFDEDRFPDYQKLGHDGPGGRADAMLDEIVREAARLTAVDASPIYLVGFSGGAQFAHRYTMAHPERVAGAILVSAGWYTFPDPTVRYPYGLEPSRRHALIDFDPEGFLRVPITVLVSREDDSNDSLRRTERCDRQQGVTRRERGHNWVKAMRAAAEADSIEPMVDIEEFPGGSHSFKEFMQSERHAHRIFELLFGDRGCEAAPARGVVVGAG